MPPTVAILVRVLQTSVAAGDQYDGRTRLARSVANRAPDLDTDCRIFIRRERQTVDVDTPAARLHAVRNGKAAEEHKNSCLNLLIIVPFVYRYFSLLFGLHDSNPVLFTQFPEESPPFEKLGS